MTCPSGFYPGDVVDSIDGLYLTFSRVNVDSNDRYQGTDVDVSDKAHCGPCFVVASFQSSPLKEGYTQVCYVVMPGTVGWIAYCSDETWNYSSMKALVPKLIERVEP